MPFRIEVNPHLELRLLEESDAGDLFALANRNRARLREWLPWVDRTRTAHDTRRFIVASLRRFADNGGPACGVWLDGTLTGSIDLHQIDWQNRSSSIGYWLAAEFEGRGIMTASCRALVDHAIDALRLNRIEIRCGLGNTRSQAVPERLGFTREGVLHQAQWVNDRFVDLVLYGMLAADWTSMRSTST